jgi:threonine dehydratase
MEGAPVKLPKINSFVDGAAVARIGDNTFRMLSWIDRKDVLLAPEDRVCVTMLEMLNHEGIVLEPAGALSVDVLPELAEEIRGKTVVCVTSGGNFDFERLPEVKERAQRFRRAEEVLHPAHAAASGCLARIPESARPG